MYKTAAIVVLLVASCRTTQAAPETVTGRYVNVSIPGYAKILSLAEVQVYSAGKNVAQGKKAGQTSIGSDGAASRAVDGNTSGKWEDGSITHTAEVTNDPAWEVDLRKNIAIEEVVIFNRDGYEGRLHGCRVAVLDENRKVVWGVDVPQPGSGATELVVKNHPKPDWLGKAVAKIAGAPIGNTESLRLAINDLIATFGNRYPKGKEYLARLDAIDADDGDDVEGLEKLCHEALLENPLLDFDKLLLIKRRGNLGLPQNWQGNCVMRGEFDNEIAVLSPVCPDGKLTTLFRPENKSFVGDVDLHWDARKMLISQRGANNRYEVFEIDVDGGQRRQVTPSEPDVDNYDACYLPDDRIIYDSTSCFQGVPCVGGNDQVANLHIINPDGTGIRRLCFDQDHDWCPTVMNDGRVMFTRWEYSDTPHYFTRVVMRMNPDGTGQTALYGSNSLWPNSTFYSRPIPGHPSKFVGIISGHHGVPRMGELIVFDPALGQREADGVVQRIPGYGQKVEPIIRDNLVDGSWPKFLHPFPLSEKYFLTACQLNPQSPWGVYLVDVFDNIVPICVEPGVAMLEPVPLRETRRPSAIPDKVDTSRKDAIVYMNDVYAGGGLKGVPRGTVKRLRLFAFDYGYQGLANHTYIGIEGPWDVHRIVGTVKVESDGSAAFRVPANTPLAVQPLDEDGKALQLMRSWFVAMPGENLSCVGCHEDTTGAPPTHQTVATKKGPQEIAPWFGPARGFSFDREVQPMLDKYCVGCHNDKPYKGRQLTDLRQDNVQTYSRAYKTLQQHVRRPGPESDYHMFPAAEYYADTSPLIQMLRKGHHGVKLDREASERLYTWIDLNVPYYGTWGEFREIPRGQRQRRAELRQLYAGVGEDYEDVPELSADPVEPIIPTEPEPKEVVKVECPDWPLSDADARTRQGEDCQRTVTLGTVNDRPVQITLVRVPAGEFVMGNADGRADAGPPCRVRIERPFWISKTIVTNEQFNLFDPEHDSRYLDRGGKDHSNRGNPLNRPEQPVVRVSWARAKAFCDWFSKQTGRRYALPTEAQWEYTCRAGSGSGRAWGVEQMPGNLGEWTRTTHRPYPYAPSDVRDDASAEGRKVVRGAKALGAPGSDRDTYRLSYHWWQGVWDVGFRIICEDEELAPEEIATAE
ncbi:MAG: SUMF1/EgtB/PvdO family nonheme iron enzyme [Planctomycetes bacterium]|nr:SUMF1/EgtB/PvdO family nonheme iron enzyme [Planctomycetota bacterium]